MWSGRVLHDKRGSGPTISHTSLLREGKSEERTLLPFYRESLVTLLDHSEGTCQETGSQ